ncbi:hypothetical protein HPP92_006568 [Vanilla planifolia]|uniref:Uncharacterized protein n=1 Tax=Vanilla planifolia TaxID=51239 RepID=A0A835R916_VANPL|nr:hypothetical protein HPP92_006827 [Vanilla planifolia]KAG0489705.1 hypothetical protein HPP92_006568 [Vanilla planifolia]
MSEISLSALDNYGIFGSNGQGVRLVAGSWGWIPGKCLSQVPFLHLLAEILLVWVLLSFHCQAHGEYERRRYTGIPRNFTVVGLLNGLIRLMIEGSARVEGDEQEDGDDDLDNEFNFNSIDEDYGMAFSA